MTRNRQAVWILGLAALFLIAFGLFACWSPWRAELAETNFQANLIRLQAFLFNPAPHTILVGSSMTGRLLPSYFEGTPLAPVANLGLDGSGSLLGLELALTNPAPLIVIEENTFLRSANANDALLTATLRSPAFRLSKQLPLLRAQARPSSVLYAWLKLRGKERATPARIPLSTSNNASAPISPSPDQDATLGTVRDQLRNRISMLIARGCRIVLLRLNSSQQGKGPQPAGFVLGDDLAREFNLTQVDLEAECSSRGNVVTYTDGVHLSASSARQASQLLVELLTQGVPTAALTRPANVKPTELSTENFRGRP